MGRFTKQLMVLCSEATEVPEAELESNIAYGGRTCTSLQQSTTDTIQPNTAEVGGRSHANSVLECPIKSSSRHFARGAEFGHRGVDQARFVHILINLPHHRSGPLLRSN